jgi:hypothetical protein
MLDDDRIFEVMQQNEPFIINFENAYALTQ